MKTIIVKLLVKLCINLDFNTLQIETLNYYEEHSPSDALKIFTFRKARIEASEKKPEYDENWDY